MKMKKNIFVSLLIVALMLSILCACGTTNTTDPVGTSGVGDTSADTSGDNAGQYPNVLIVEKDSVKIHSISELNTEDEGVDSHAGLESYSSLELNKRESTNLANLDLGGVSIPYYPRIRQMLDGTYIMTYHSTRLGGNVYAITSKDGVRWTNPRVILAAETHPDYNNDTILYMTPDLCVTDDGTIIIVSAFRGRNMYSKDVNANGIVVVRSTDGGKSWSQPQKIYTGTNWEPFIMQTSSGEIQVYFTQTGHLLAEHGWSEERRSSCVGLLRSNDDGITWTKQVGYSAQIVMQEYVFNKNGYDYMNDQMPVAVELNNGTIALAAEYYNAKDSYKISLAYSKDNWAKSLGYNEVGPSTLAGSVISGAGPYIDQFYSGETVLSTHSSEMNTYIGTANASNFKNAYSPFAGNKGHWSSVYVDSTHSVMGCMANTISGDISSPTATTLDVGRMYLNHVVYAKKSDITVDGKTDDWDNNTSALFIGSTSQAQMSMRFSYDDENIYILYERLDNYMMENDAEGIYIPLANNQYYLIKMGATGVVQSFLFDGERMKVQNVEGISWAATIVGGLGDTKKDTGKILEVCIPRSMTVVSDAGLFMFNATIYNTDKSGSDSDNFSNVDAKDRTTWQRIYLTK